MITLSLTGAIASQRPGEGQDDILLGDTTLLWGSTVVTFQD